MKKLYFFYSRNCHSSFVDITLEVWCSEPVFYAEENIHGDDFKIIEKLELHACKSHSVEDKRSRFHCCTLEHEKSLNSCVGSSAKTEQEFLQEKAHCEFLPLTQIAQKDFLRFKKVILGIYQSYPDIDFDNFENA